MMKDVAVIGGGMAGLATAARLQAQGMSTLVLEAHGQPGGCTGFYRRRGFAFDVGATTLVDFEPDGVGAHLLDEIGLTFPGERLPGYVAWLPDRQVTLYRNPHAWAEERRSRLGNTPAHRQLWHTLDRLAAIFWEASRNGIRLPVRSVREALAALRAIGPANLPLVRYLTWTMGDLLRRLGLRDDPALVGLLSMLIEDTTHSTVDEAPLINAALGITIRGAGLTRAEGGMYGFWRHFLAQYRACGGELRLGCPVERVEGEKGAFRLTTRRGVFEAAQVVSAVPIALTAQIAPAPVAQALQPYLRRDANALGGALILFLGVPEAEVSGQAFTHHQLLQDYSAPLGNGNNLFLSVSAAGDTLSAPPGCRAVMLSTHCELAAWEGLSPEDYRAQKQEVGAHLLLLARRVYPELGENALVSEMGTPQTYARFTGRPRGAVGGVRQTLANANQHAVPHALGMDGFFLAGDTTWPGLGTVACVLGSRIVAEAVRQSAQTWTRQHVVPRFQGGEYAPADNR